MTDAHVADLVHSKDRRDAFLADLAETLRQRGVEYVSATFGRNQHAGFWDVLVQTPSGLLTRCCVVGAHLHACSPEAREAVLVHFAREAVSGETRDMVIDVQHSLAGLTPDQRRAFMADLLDHVCVVCGSALPKYDACACGAARFDAEDWSKA